MLYSKIDFIAKPQRAQRNIFYQNFREGNFDKYLRENSPPFMVAGRAWSCNIFPFLGENIID